MKAIQLEEFGGADSLRYVEVPDPVPGEGEVLLDVVRVGVNFADTHVTHNEYLAKHELPLIPGAEVAARTPDGRRVAAILDKGGYAQRVAAPAESLVSIPDAVSDDAAAAVLLQGLTAHALVHRCARLEPGETVVVQAAAGGTGGLAVQLARRAGARVIGLASTPEKRALAERLGAHATVDSRAEDLREAILAANDGEPVDAVFEMTGGATFEACLRALAPLGRMVVFGIASGAQNQVASGHLLRHSRAVIGFWLMHLLPQREAVRAAVAELFEAVASGELEIVIGSVYPLSQARRAHEDLAARRTEGKLLLDPSA